MAVRRSLATEIEYAAWREAFKVLHLSFDLATSPLVSLLEEYVNPSLQVLFDLAISALMCAMSPLKCKNSKCWLCRLTARSCSRCWTQ